MRLLLFAFVLLFLPIPIKAQSPQFKRYGLKEGLPSSEVYNVMVDSKGYLWFATNMGACRYDGYSFKIFNMENGLPDNTIFECYEDYKGRVWFRSFSGKMSYYYQDSLYLFGKNSLITEIINSGGYSSSMYIDKHDTLWLGLSGGNLLKGDKVIKISGKYRTFPGIKTSIKDTLDSLHLMLFKNNCFFIFPGGNVRGRSAPLDSLSIIDNSRVLYTLYLGKSLDYNQASAGLVRKDGTFLTAFLSSLIHFSKKGIIGNYRREKVLSLMEDPEGNLWVGSYYGVTMYPKGDLTSKDTTLYLKGFVISGMAMDKEGGIWFSSTQDGVFYLYSKDILYYKTPDGLATKAINCLSKVSKLSSSANLDHNPFLIQPYESNVSLLAGAGEIRNILQVPNGDIWIFGDAPLQIYHRGKIKQGGHFPLKKGLTTPAGVMGFYMSEFDLISYDLKKTKLVVASERLYAFYKDRQERVWIGSNKGLLKYENQQLVDESNGNPILKSRITDINETPDGTLWLATKTQGLIVKAKNSIYSITTKEGLTSNNCTSLLVDSGNVIWVATYDGISRIKVLDANKRKYVISNYNYSNGLWAKEINQIIKVGRRIWLACNDGITSFDPEKFSFIKTPPPIYINEVDINGMPRKHWDKLSLDYRENYLTIKYVGLTYKNPGALQYKYKMSGVDGVWKYTTNTSIQYTTLPAGHYTFSIYAVSRDNVESKVPCTFSFTIHPPFWETWWFIFASVAGVTGLIALFFFQRIKQLKNREEMNQKLVENELTALRAQMNPHFIFNSINSVQRFILNNEADASQRFLSKFAKLIRYVVDHSNLSLIPLNEELNALKMYMDLEQVRLKDKFEYSIEIDEGLDTEVLQIPSMLLQPYVENAIWHAFTNKEDKGKINISIAKNDGGLRFVIEDNGIGRERAAQYKSHNRVGHKSKGIKVTNERLKIINSGQKKKISISIIDLYQDKVPNGTRIELFIPLNTI